MTTMLNTRSLVLIPPAGGPMAARPRPPVTPCPLLLDSFCWLLTGRPPRPVLTPLGAVAYGHSSFRTWLRDPREQGTDLGLPVPAVSTEGTDRRQLAGLCPASHRLGIHPEHGRYLCRREQRLGLGRACRHVYGLPFLDRDCDPVQLLPGSAGSLSWRSYMAH